MFNDVNEIYNSIAENILTAVSGDWDMVLLNVFIFDVDKSIGIKGVSTYLGEETFFNILKSDFEHGGISTSAAFLELYKRMKRSDSDTPWNKCRFSLSCDGDLDIESILEFLKSSVQEDEFICSSPHYYNDEKETSCLPFLTEE